MAFTLPNLPYAFEALEPHIDARTMEIHHDKHHAAYVNNLNAAIQGTEYENADLKDLFTRMGELPPAIRNNGGGHWNHSFFWEILSPNGGGEPVGDLASKMEKIFATFDNFKKEFAKAAVARFGSGWVWLCVDEEDNLFITSTPNQDNPLMDVAERHGAPIIGLDVWEHAYYLNFQNRRPDYVEAWWNVVNWEEANRRYRSAVRSN